MYFLSINHIFECGKNTLFCDANLIKSRQLFAIVEEYPSTNLAEAASSRYCAFKYSTKVSTLVLFHVQLVSHQTPEN
jgi:hypothetical protein